ncbi:NADP-dependent malic enzyme [Kordia sp. TARA_039_SRF]|nr:NADP-dependent malic enzyme [Kordia sp. TARA_039_SRF]MAF32291.1 NADP-dependent malic enzyme [Magnetococcales bacterium]|tara:strand:+ start:679 stop:2988 length:2310 start_codon:yes stop_codon:yes gene_type:complete
MPEQKKAANSILYHSLPKPGKLEVVATKPLTTQEDLSLAYTPGVASVCDAIVQDKQQSYNLTSKGNLVMVVTNGTAVLGLGDIGPEASKPVMEGKAVLFKKFADIDVFDIEVNEKDPKKLVEVIKAIAPTCGGINLEDIKAPECFYVEQTLQKELDIPVFHDDQHGTGIVALAAFINSLHLTGKKKEKVKLVFSGAGAAGLACVRILVDYGVPKQNITLVDIDGVVRQNRPNLPEHLAEFAQDTDAEQLADVIEGADIFFGLSAGGVLKADMVKKMAKNPVIFAMANPTPEIMPDEVHAVRNDAIVGTGRSDFPNQVNNVLVFPYVFRGALDCGATTVNKQMKIAAAEGIAALARQQADSALDVAYKGKTLKFGPEYVIPKPFDSRLVSIVAPAVAQAAMDSGVARRPIEDMEAYAASLKANVDQSFSLMRQIFSSAKKEPKRVVYPEAEDARVLRAAQTLSSEGICHPVLIGRRDKVMANIQNLGLNMVEGEDYTFIDPNNHEKHGIYTDVYYNLRKRDGISMSEAEIIMRSRWTALGAMMVREGDADSMVVGVTGKFDKFMRATLDIIPMQPGVKSPYAIQMIMHKGKVFFIGDTNVNVNPTAEQIAEMACLAAEEVKHFGVEPSIALLSHSNFGTHRDESALKMQKASHILSEEHPDLMVEGEMQADSALDMEVLRRSFPDAKLEKEANVLIMPNVDTASIAFNLLKKTLSNADNLGPILLGLSKPIHILSTYASVRQIVNMSALSVVEAQGMDVNVQQLKTAKAL